MRTLKLTFFSILFFLLSSCSSIFNPLNNEAKGELNKLLGNSFSKCGEIFAGVKDDKIVQVKNPTFSFAGSGISEADKLNGVEWKGIGIFECSSYKLNKDLSWDECPTDNSKMSAVDTYLYVKYFGTSIDIKKINGEWHVNSDIKDIKPLDCSKLSN